MELKNRLGLRQAALLVPNGWAGAEADLKVAGPASGAFPGHSALVVLAQQVCDVDGALLNQGIVFLTYAPTDADKGMFLEQCRNSRLYYCDAAGRVFRCGITKDNVAASEQLPNPQVNTGGLVDVLLNSAPAWRPRARAGGGWEIQHTGAMRQLTLPGNAPDRVKAENLFAARDNLVLSYRLPTRPTLPGVRLPNRPRQVSTYGALNGAGKRLFDEIALCTVLALIPIRELSIAANLGPLNAPEARGNEVASLLYSQDGRILSWGLNTKDANQSHHAEVTLVKRWQQSYGRRPFPDAARLYSTLEPCFMCSGLLADAYGAVNNLKVVFAQDDPACSNAGRQTFLDRLPGNVASNAHTLGIRYSSSGSTWGQKLEVKQAAFGAGGAARAGIYAQSTINLLAEQVAFRRRLAKASTQLTGIGAQILIEAQAGARPFLTEMWVNALRFLAVASGWSNGTAPLTQAQVEGMLYELADLLQDTRHQNPDADMEIRIDILHNDGARKFRDQVDTLLGAVPGALYQ